MDVENGVATPTRPDGGLLSDPVEADHAFVFSLGEEISQVSRLLRAELIGRDFLILGASSVRAWWLLLYRGC